MDAEAELFVVDEPIGPDDRVLAGLSVAFDASCEEMWLAWRHGACLVPAPRALVRTGMDLGPWLAAQRITIVSTVPTLATLWPDDALDQVRLLIFGGEACPPALVERVAVPGREVWNTYGPTEATVVACAAPLEAGGPVRIGLPLAGWDLEVVDPAGEPVGTGEVGELIIGGVGLARYLDPIKDAERFAAMPVLGWARAYRSGDLVERHPEGLVFVGRADEQVKVGGRRIELGEIDAALQALPGVTAAASAVQTTAAGNQVLVGYVVTADALDVPAATTRLRASLPAALVPRVAIVDELPTRTSGKVDRAAPCPGHWRDRERSRPAELSGTEAWVATQWTEVLGAAIRGAEDDFFELGGGSLAAAQLVSALRRRYPSATVADVYAYPRLAALADHLDATGDGQEVTAPEDREWVVPTSRRTQLLLSALTLGLQTVVGARWLVWLALLNNLFARTHAVPWIAPVSWWWVVAGIVLLITPVGPHGDRGGGRAPAPVPRPAGDPSAGGHAHVRLWAADRLIDAAGAANLAGAPWIATFARALGASVGRGVDLHSLPPVTGLLTLGDGASIEPEVDLSGYWLDGDRLHLGRVHVGVGCHRGLPQHPAPRRVGGRRSGDRAWLGRRRRGPARCPLVGFACSPGGQATAQLAGPRPAPWGAVAPPLRRLLRGHVGAPRPGGGRGRPRAGARRGGSRRPR